MTPAHTPVRDTRGWSTSVAAQVITVVGACVVDIKALCDIGGTIMNGQPLGPR